MVLGTSLVEELRMTLLDNCFRYVNDAHQKEALLCVFIICQTQSVKNFSEKSFGHFMKFK